MEGATVVLVEPGTTDILYSTTTSFGSAGGGYFTFNFTFEQMTVLMGGLHHRTITFKVYEGAVFLGCLDALVSAVSFMGSQTFEVKVDASYTPPDNGFLYAIAGQVLEVDGSPIPNLDVKVYAEKMASEELLETEQTASDGRFLVRYEGPSHSHPDQALIDITVRAYDGQTLIASAGPICNLRHDLTITLVRDDEELRGATIFDSFVAGITPQNDTVGVAFGLALACLDSQRRRGLSRIIWAAPFRPSRNSEGNPYTWRDSLLYAKNDDPDSIVLVEMLAVNAPPRHLLLCRSDLRRHAVVPAPPNQRQLFRDGRGG